MAIVHLGLGAFHRAHMAAYTEDAEAAEPRGFGIAGVTMRSADIRERLTPQDGLYTLVERGPEGERARIIGVVRDVLSAPDDPAAVIARIAAPGTRIVSFTITEKGYALDPATRQLRLDDPGIAHDLANPAAPRTGIGLLAAGLARRRMEGLAGLTALCCDNLPSNGATLSQATLAFASTLNPALADWIAREVSFPSCMVDRIVPATTAEDRAAAERLTGLEDAAPVMAEPFSQWVVEDRFRAGRPAWERAGVEFVEDVAPYELMKLRLLNGSHSAMAYLGSLVGLSFIWEVVSDPDFHRFVEGLMGEAAETVPLPTGDYREALLARFANPALGHRCRQIAMDGSQKLPQRLVGPIRERLAEGRSISHLAAAVAAWLRYVAGVDEQGRAYEVDDPLASRLADLQRDKTPEDRFAALIRFEPVFGTELPQDPRFVMPVADAYRLLWARGARALVASLTPA
ncbi:MAG: mannitol dehydrogenase family protein [Pseudomonadota bacterium]|nr:mannitol dehydrogenase family protein [Pseudomonadota bacterium]